jgi:hypothetical protein
MPVREPFGIVALEAMAASKPLIAVDEGGYVEVVDSECAFLIPPHVDALVEKISWLQQHPEQGKVMGLHGRELAKGYTWDKTARELLEELEETRISWLAENAIIVDSQTNPTIFGAHYYGWYGDGLGSSHWNDATDTGAVTELPSLGYYASISEDVIENHLRMAEQIGLDFFVFNLHADHTGVSQRESKALSAMLDRAKYLRSPVKICVQLCLYGCSESTLIEICSKLRTSVFTHQNYLNYIGQPLLSFFWTGQYDGDRAFLQLLQKQASPALLLASSLRMYPPGEEQGKTSGIFDGWSIFSPLELASPGAWSEVWRSAYDNAEAGKRKIRCVTVSPGYNDIALTSLNRQGNANRLIPRDNGATYRQMWEFALDLPQPPHIVFISTFNEFHENTHIEPTAGTGSLYLDLTHEFIRQGKALWNT